MSEQENELVEWGPLFNSVEGTPVAIAKIDYNKNILDCTTHFASLLGMDRTEASTKNVERDITLREDKPTTHQRFEQIKLGEHVATMKHYLRKDGSTILCYIVAIPMKGWILDFMYQVNEFNNDLEKEINALNAIIDSYRHIISNHKPFAINMNQTNQSNNVTNTADNGASLNTGTAITNDSNFLIKSLKWLIIPLALTILYGFYYMAVIATDDTPEKPNIDILSPENEGTEDAETNTETTS